MIIGFSGSQSGMTFFQKDELFKLLKMKGCIEFHHGDCKGSDEQANFIAIESGIKTFCIHPPTSSRKRAFCFDAEKQTQNVDITSLFKYIDGFKVKWFPTKGYLERNKDIVNSTELLIATPKEYTHTLRSGTWATIRYCWKNKKNLIIIPPVERQDPITEDSAMNG